MGTEQIALFPLRTVLFPDGPLPLRVFEPRYLDMVSSCLKQEVPFGVLLIVSGAEAGSANVASTASIGTLAKITDWYQGSDGILGVTAIGIQRFRLLEVDQQPDGLHVGQIERLPAEARQPLPPDYESMAELLRAIIDDLGKLYGELPRRYEDATWVGCRFAEILPMPLEQKQRCLECDDPMERLNLVRPMLRTIRWETSQ